MLGHPLPIYVEKDVQDRDLVVDLITVGRVAYISADSYLCCQKHGGAISPGYSGVPYIIGMRFLLLSRLV